MSVKEKSKKVIEGQQIYKVRIFKDFEFPSFSVDRYNTLHDLNMKAMQEVREAAIAITEEAFFDFEVINVLPFTLKTEQALTTGNMDFDFFIREISLERLREKYGEISYEKNPDIFVKIENSATRVTFNLKPEIEDCFVDTMKRYIDLFNNKRIYR